jgi:hypothetical protein
LEKLLRLFSCHGIAWKMDTGLIEELKDWGI